MDALVVKNLSKDFGGVTAVKDVSFKVEEGEHIAIIGPNGAGKTTLFNLLSGQLPPTAGQVFFFGQDVTHLPAHQPYPSGHGPLFPDRQPLPQFNRLA